jgi:hypothetical protein
LAILAGLFFEIDGTTKTVGHCDALIAKRAEARQVWRGFGSQETPSGWNL